MVGGGCYASGCKSGNNRKEKCHFMRISKQASESTRMKWLRNIPTRDGKPWNFDTYALCHLHFEDKYVIKTSRVMYNGQVMAEEARKRWKLTDDAVPTIFGDKISRIASAPGSKRKKSPTRGKTGSKAQRVQTNQNATTMVASTSVSVIPKRAELNTDLVAMDIGVEEDDEEEMNSAVKKPCLICCHIVKSGIRLNSFLSKPECPANPNTQNTVNENLKVLFLFVLKEVLDFSSDEISSLMSKSRGTEMSEWIHFCKSCFDSINQIVEFQEKIKKMEESIKLHKANVLSKIMTASQHRRPVSVEDSAQEKSCVTVTDNIRKIISQRRAHLSPVKSAFNSARGEQEPGTRIQQQIDFPEVGTTNEDIASFDDSIISESFQRHSDIIFSDILNEEKDKAKYREVSLKLLYCCPLCPSTEPKMDIVKLVPHLMFHKDHPIKCSQCQAYFPDDGIQLYRHWMEFHRSLTTIPVHERYLEMKLSDATAEELRLQQDPANDAQESSIECADCPNGSQSRFSDTNQLKIHQVLDHPDVLLVSCPVCPKLVNESSDTRQLNSERLLEHLGRLHHECAMGIMEYNPCRFCGKMFSSSGSEKFHVVMKHGALINLKYLCTLCSIEYSSLSEFLQHFRNAPPEDVHSKLEYPMKLDATSIVILKPMAKNECGLCITKQYDIPSFEELAIHLTGTHSLKLKWGTELVKPWKPRWWKYVELQVIVNETKSKIEEQNHFLSEDKERKRRNRQAEYLKRRPSKYTCSMCPSLGKMNFDEFVAHLIFHRRRSAKCSACSLYFPTVPGIMEKHWTLSHKDLMPEVGPIYRFQTVKINTGKVFNCERCQETFETIQDRDAHENEIHHTDSAKPERCTVCDECFRNNDELRLHKALNHPEVACVSCYYCDKEFGRGSTEGVKFRDEIAVEKHILETENHNEGIHLVPCSYCGEVLKSSRGSYSRNLRKHALEKHGIPEKLALTCTICYKNVPFQTLWDHKLGSHAPSEICGTCGEVVLPMFLPDHCLSKHDLVMEGFTAIHCTEEGCSFKALKRLQMNRHVKVHHQKKPRQRQNKGIFGEI